MDFKIGYKILQLDLWKILDDFYNGVFVIFYKYNYFLK